jgi:hypothetical protein
MLRKLTSDVSISTTVTVFMFLCDSFILFYSAEYTLAYKLQSEVDLKTKLTPSSCGSETSRGIHPGKLFSLALGTNGKGKKLSTVCVDNPQSNINVISLKRRT